MNKIKKNDIVRVITGKDKGKEGKVVSVNIESHKVLVEGINQVKKHQKAGRVPGVNESAIITREMPIDISNVALVVGGKTTRVGFKVDDKGNKVRIARKTGKTI